MILILTSRNRTEEGVRMMCNMCLMNGWCRWNGWNLIILNTSANNLYQSNIDLFPDKDNKCATTWLQTIKVNPDIDEHFARWWCFPQSLFSFLGLPPFYHFYHFDLWFGGVLNVSGGRISIDKVVPYSFTSFLLTEIPFFCWEAVLLNGRICPMTGFWLCFRISWQISGIRRNRGSDGSTVVKSVNHPFEKAQFSLRFESYAMKSVWQQMDFANSRNSIATLPTAFTTSPNLC
jgi:hypothetical protein